MYMYYLSYCINVDLFCSLAVDIIFEPHVEGLFNYNLIVEVKKKPSPLQINVKGEGYKMQVACSVQDEKGSQLTLLPGNTNNIVNFGEVGQTWEFASQENKFIKHAFKNLPAVYLYKVKREPQVEVSMKFCRDKLSSRLDDKFIIS